MTGLRPDDSQMIAEVYSGLSLGVITEHTPENDVEQVDQFKINRVKIYVKRGEQNPEIMYRGKVIDYDDRDVLTTITANTEDNRRIILKIDKRDSIDVTVLDGNGNMQDEFNVNGMQLRDIDNPDELSILKIEQTD